MNLMNFNVFKAAAIVAVIFMLLPLKAVGQANTYYRDCRLILSVVDAKRSSWHLMLRATSFNCFLLV